MKTFMFLVERKYNAIKEKKQTLLLFKILLLTNQHVLILEKLKKCGKIVRNECMKN